MDVGRGVLLWTLIWGIWCLAAPSFSLRHVTVSEQVSDTPLLLEVFQVYPPPLNPEELKGSTVCSYSLMQHTFAHSAGKPYVGED